MAPTECRDADSAVSFVASCLPLLDQVKQLPDDASRKIDAITDYHEETDTGLAEAKEAVVTFINSKPPPPAIQLWSIASNSSSLRHSMRPKQHIPYVSDFCTIVGSPAYSSASSQARVLRATSRWWRAARAAQAPAAPMVNPVSLTKRINHVRQHEGVRHGVIRHCMLFSPTTESLRCREALDARAALGHRSETGEQLNGLNGTFGAKKQRTTPYASQVMDYSRPTAQYSRYRINWPLQALRSDQEGKDSCDAAQWRSERPGAFLRFFVPQFRQSLRRRPHFIMTDSRPCH